ncbi:serine hydrolase domain-containing protein [Noviherbaspirillum denitrificans]|nr:serine hydrolase [Noviherbaspirillum denitrificans]
MAKSITGILVGIAHREGHIASLDDKVVQYVPQLAGTPYEEVSVRNLLRMASGVQWEQVYSPGSDNYRLNAETMMQKGRGGVSAISWVSRRAAPQGTKFNYSGGDTYVLGLVLQAAIKRPLAEYTSEKLWKPIGAEDYASWLVDWSGTVPANCCFNARLRDYGRLGAMLADDGVVSGKEIIDREYLLDATDAGRQPEFLKPGGPASWGGYGYQIWLRKNKLRTFSMHGVYGQLLLVQPASKAVIVITSAWQDAENAPNDERGYFLEAVLRTLQAIPD